MTETTDRTALGDRMKQLYEAPSQTFLPGRMPALLRVDGKAFHTFTRAMDRPFDMRLIEAMNSVALALCEEVQCTQIAYVQSDEVTLLLHNYKRLNTQGWFHNNVQKMVSVAASVATSAMTLAFGRSCAFDARVFVVPEAEVCNAFLWRQQDATRNSIKMLARSRYSHKQCDGKNSSELQEMCVQAGDNWNNLPTHLKRGRFALRNADGHWGIDNDPPILTADRDYIDRHLAISKT
jgi:tRNA(His) guanylyltransferase